MGTSSTADTRTELTDSLLHTRWLRVIVGGVCGGASGALLLFLTSLFTPVGAGKMWWAQVLATLGAEGNNPRLIGGEALAFDAAASVINHGLMIHFAISIMLGIVFGKITTSSDPKRLIPYGLVLGGLCWLGSNMFAPDILNVSALDGIAQWSRMFLFQSFTISLAIFMALASKILKV